MVHVGFYAPWLRGFVAGDGRIGVRLIVGWAEGGGGAVIGRNQTDRVRQKDQLTDEWNFGIQGIYELRPRRTGHDVVG